MAYQVLARKYRPQRFEEIIGQDHVVRTLKNAITTGRIAHAFIFVGPRGIGKTSTARILAMALNAPDGPRIDFNPDDDVCREIAEGRSMDVLEIDGASNNNVDQIRELRENVQYTPSKGKFKVYIIDEVHMLSPAAFNALLKTLEEPPAHVKFIFATTEPQKVLATILSRCQRFDLKRIPDQDIIRQLDKIAKEEKIQIHPDALKMIARNAEGGMRDAESALDQLISFCGNEIKESDALEVFGLTGHREVWNLAESILAGASEDALRQVRDLVNRGKDLTRLTQELLRYFRNLLVFLVSRDAAREDLDETEYHHYEAMQPLPGSNLVLAFIDELVSLEEKIRMALVKEVLFEISILRMAQQKEKVAIEDIIQTLMKGGTPPAPAQVLPAPPVPTPKTTTPPAVQPATPPAATPPDKPATAPPPPSPDDIHQTWTACAQSLSASSDPVLQRAVQTCSVHSLAKGTLHLKMIASAPVYQALVNSQSFSKLEKEVAQRFGAGTRVSIQFEERHEPEEKEEKVENPSSPENPESPTDAASPGTPPPRELSQAEFENDPLIRAALDAFAAKIVDIRQKA